MHVRPLRSDEGDRIRQIARESLVESYSGLLGTDTIDAAVDTWYDSDAITDAIESESVLVLVAEIEGTPIGFAQSRILKSGRDGRIEWIHVLPEHRGGGSGVALFEATMDALEDRGVAYVTAAVLADHAEGRGFYERRGFETAFDRPVEIGSETYTENVYAESAIDIEPLEVHRTADGEEVFVDSETSDRGSKGPFFTVYLSASRDDRYGQFCGNCESLSTAMDSMGRIQCTDCGNTRKPTRWDAAYL
ncbi:MAG: GNAT family N-acetyltransferase [Halobacteriota archaeon]